MTFFERIKKKVGWIGWRAAIYYVVVVVVAAVADRKKDLDFFSIFPCDPANDDAMLIILLHWFSRGTFFVVFGSATSLLCYFSGAKSFFHCK